MYSSQFLLSSFYLENHLYLVNHHYLKIEVFFFIHSHSWMFCLFLLGLIVKTETF